MFVLRCIALLLPAFLLGFPGENPAGGVARQPRTATRIESQKFAQALPFVRAEQPKTSLDPETVPGKTPGLWRAVPAPVFSTVWRIAAVLPPRIADRPAPSLTGIVVLQI